ncbi:MAG: dCTP deaminase [Candidatus Nanoarchaeia archaeon]|nr:dCTP deaminase [Candidatus Nanoarchaeia archaeon]
MILSQKEILERIKNGEVKVEPFDKEQVGPASIDLTLDNQIRVFEKKKTIFHTKEKDIFKQYKKYTTILHLKKGGFYILKPYEMVHGITKEKITLPEDLCGWLQGRTTFARLGLSVHVTASFIQPGISNRQVLEIVNFSPYEIALYPGTRICQLVLQRMEGKAKYKGKVRNQMSP